MVLGIRGFLDEILHSGFPYIAAPALHPAPLAFTILLWALAAFALVLSVRPTLNLLSSHQLMNFSYNRYHLVNTYGAFGSVSRERHEIVLEGTTDLVLTPSTIWKEYGFKGKPSDLYRMPPQVAPYHLRLDWMVWFLPFTVVVTPHGIHVRGYEIWFLRFVQKLLSADSGILGLTGNNPFPDRPPAFIRARFYHYTYTDHRRNALAAPGGTANSSASSSRRSTCVPCRAYSFRQSWTHRRTAGRRRSVVVCGLRTRMIGPFGIAPPVTERT